MARKHNGALFQYNTIGLYHTSEYRPRSYALDVNPDCLFRKAKNGLNRVDMRWVDVDTGVYMNISAARYSDDPEKKGMLYTKDGHEYQVSNNAERERRAND